MSSIRAVDYARSAWRAQRDRSGFPSWARDISPLLDDIDALLREDRRRVVSHNDVNPGNVLWDGRKAWLIDWEVSSLAHPYYDLAALTTFLDMNLESASTLLELQERRTPDARDLTVFAALRRLSAIAVGCTLLGLVPTLDAAPASRTDAPTLGDIYAAMRAGTFDIQSGNGQTAFALAFLRPATEP